ncbi:MAG: lipopolysaccharide biosynthesis protein [Myxococcales bacterium]|nr:lipopolysaccharide biosynthesis protein [Myxococcales bacterium]MCB9578359.1 lipopolysaccharide biosynthesis protein [Polyangiaceae bacterium]
MSLARTAGAGVAWTGAGRFVAKAGGFVVTLVLARLLTPADFGLVGMIAVVTGFLSVLADLGFSDALVQRKEVDEGHWTSVFWLNVATGFVLAGGLAALAPAIAAFFREPALTALVRVIGLDFAISPFAAVPTARLTREMRFRTLAGVEAISVIVASGVALGMALAGFGVWALVAHVLASSLTSVLVLWSVSGFRPQGGVRQSALGDLWRFSSNLLGYSTLHYWTRKSDDLLIGRVLGATPLGLYGRAYSTMTMPVSDVGAVLARVMFPTFSKMQGDAEATKKLYLQVLSLIAMGTFPVMLALSVLAPRFIVVLYGDQWAGAATVLSIFCVTGAFQAISTTVSWIYKSQGRTDVMMRWGLVSGTLTVGAIGVGIYLGSIESVALCYAIMNVVVLGYPELAIPGKLIGLAPVEIFRSVRGALGCSLASTGVIFGLGFVLSPYLSGGADVFVRLTIGVLVYVTLLRVFGVESYQQFRRMAEERLNAYLADEPEAEAPEK